MAGPVKVIHRDGTVDEQPPYTEEELAAIIIAGEMRLKREDEIDPDLA